MSVRTLFTVLDDAARVFGSLPALHQPSENRKENSYRTYSWIEYRDAAREIACGLATLGIGHGDIVALDSETRAEFYLADLGIMSNGAIAAALYTSLPPVDRAKNLHACHAKAVFVENPRTRQLLLDAGAPAAIPWILLSGEVEGAISLDHVRAQGRTAESSDPGFFERIQARINPDDTAILYLTSGATGEPKMGLTTHQALINNLDMGPKVLKLTAHDSTLAFLPSAHIAQRVVVELLPIPCGMPVWFSEGLAKMPAELRSIKPTFFLAPPRVWERIYATVSTELKKRPAAARKLAHGALGLALRASRLRHEGKPVPAWMQRLLKIADKVVFSKIRERLGGRLRLACSGAAPLGRDLAQFYDAIGLPLIEGYGLTEGGVVTVNPLNAPRAGSIGKLLPDVQMKLTDDGELLLRAPTLFTGYYQDPSSTAMVLRDGWLHTGDIAEVDRDGYIYITGRKKELIVSSNGKKIYPARIEALLKTDPLVNQVLLLGDRQPYVTALFTLNVANAETLPGMDTFKGKPLEEMAQAPGVVAQIEALVKRVNKQLPPFEHIKRWRILTRDFSLEQGELTPTMKVRRQKVMDNFRDVVNDLYLGREEMV